MWWCRRGARPLVEEGSEGGASHGTVLCVLCLKHGIQSSFTGEGYTYAPALADHYMICCLLL